MLASLTSTSSSHLIKVSAATYLHQIIMQHICSSIFLFLSRCSCPGNSYRPNSLLFPPGQAAVIIKEAWFGAKLQHPIESLALRNVWESRRLGPAKHTIFFFSISVSGPSTKVSGSQHMARIVSLHAGKAREHVKTFLLSSRIASSSEPLRSRAS